jgi:hypothetical protein
MPLEKILYEPIFERMKADHAQPAGRGEQIEALFERAVDLLEFVVDLHAQRLKRTSRRMLARFASRHGFRDDRREPRSR